jgi:phosphoribosyl 1,2-cyclic phosphate phosphodiesterase
VYGPGPALEFLRASFRYIFDDGVRIPEGTSRPRLTLHELTADVTVDIGGLTVLPLAFDHGYSTVFGYRVGPVAYVTDVKSVPAEARERLRGVQVLVLSALWWRAHPTHQSIADAIEAAQAIGAERTYLTHLSHETNHRELLRRLPACIEPGYDGLTVEVDG